MSIGSPFPKEECVNPYANTELDLLREFFDRWETLHCTPRGPGFRQQAMQNAQLLVDAADGVRRFRNVGKSPLTARFDAQH